jgi:hypothetical protein
VAAAAGDKANARSFWAGGGKVEAAQGQWMVTPDTLVASQQVKCCDDAKETFFVDNFLGY